MSLIEYSEGATALGFVEGHTPPIARCTGSLAETIKIVVETWDPARIPAILIIGEGRSFESYDEARSIYDRPDFPLERTTIP